MSIQEFARASSIGPVRLINLQPPHDDIQRFKTALARTFRQKAFLNATLPGLITAFQVNRHEAIVTAGFAHNSIAASARLPAMARSIPP